MSETLFDSDLWVFKFIFILIAYLTVALPVYFLVLYVRRKWKACEIEPTNVWKSFLISFAVGRCEYELAPEEFPGRKSSSKANKSLFADCLHICSYFVGLQVTLVMMGFVQEKMMTQGYKSTIEKNVERFTNTQFLVLMNRIFALAFSGIYIIIRWKKEPIHVHPFYKHSYTSFSNTLSSWCQYEALKYVSFPVQTVCKASKILPTMLMGRIVRGERYGYMDCTLAVLLAAGASLFLLSVKTTVSSGLGSVTTISGICLMAGYLLFDAFTLNWQKTLFDSRPRISKYQMMFAVNAFSMVLCLAVLVQERSMFSSIMFGFTHEGFFSDIMVLSASGALGQVLIYMTIEKYGPIVFAVMMTVRQIFSIILSTIAYHHPVSFSSILGLVITFSAIIANIGRQYYRASSGSS